MPLRLKLLPEYNRGENISLDVLEMDFDEVLFEKIIALEQSVGITARKPIESYLSQISAFHSSTYGPTLKTPYGDNLKGLPALNLKEVSKHKHSNWRNKACFGFVKQLPDNLIIWLFWS